MKHSLKVIFTLIGVSLVVPTYAQGGAVFDFSANFFIALIAGILLAFGFQALLTLLSVAAGINFTGPFNKQSSGSEQKSESENNSSGGSSGSIGPKISSAAGAWTLITVSLSLFFASWLAIKLTLVESNTIGLVLGLVIWAAFYTTMMYLELKSVSSLAGGLFNIAIGSVKSSISGIKSVFEANQQKQIQHTIDHSIDKIRDEITNDWHTDDIITKLDEYVEQLKPEPLDYDRIEQELKEVLNEIEIDHKTELGENGLDERTFVNIAERQPSMSKEDVQKVGGLFKKIKSANQEGTTKSHKVVAGIDKLTPGSEEDSAQFRQKVASYLKNTNAEEVQPDKLEHDLEVMLNEPKKSKQVLLNRVDQMDRETLIELVKANDKIDDQKARKLVNKAEMALNKFKSILQSAPQSARAEYDDAQDQGAGMQEELKGKAQGKKLGYEMKLRTFFNSMQRREFNYERIKLDFQRIFSNPKVAPSILKRRFQEYDRDSLIAILSKKKNVSRQDAENIVQKFEDSQHRIIEKAEQIERTVKEKFTQTKQASLNQLEAARKTAATAAWWLVGTAIISGGAAALGGILAITI